MQLTTEEQNDKAADLLAAILSSRQVPVLEGWMAFARVGMALCVLVLSSRIIATPPPFVQGFALVLPAWAWGAFLLFTAALTAVGRIEGDLCTRRNGSAGGFFVMCALMGPLWIKAPGLCCAMGVLLVPHVIVGLHLHRKCRAGDAS